MKQKILEIIKENKTIYLDLLVNLRHHLKNIEYDPITIELFLDKLVTNDYDFKTNELFIENLCNKVTSFQYDKSHRLLKLLSHDYLELMEVLEYVEELSIDIPDSSSVNDKELVKILREMYINAPIGYQMTMVHLFGIKYADQLKSVSLINLSKSATGKDSLGVEIGKGIKLSNYVKIIEDSKSDDDSFTNDDNVFNIRFSHDEKISLEKYGLIIENNERNYLYTTKDRKSNLVNGGGTPTYFKCIHFEWTGSSWKQLMIDFTRWIIEKLNFTEEELLHIKSNWSNQTVFSKYERTNYLGPFKYGLYINGNHTATHMWWQILDLADLLDNEQKNHTCVHVHYPSAIEPDEIIKLIWKKEIQNYKKYLFRQKMSANKILESIEVIKVINRIYRKEMPNYYFSNIDRKQDISNALSRLKRMDEYVRESSKLSEHLGLFVEFKKQIKYENIKKDCQI